MVENWTRRTFLTASAAASTMLAMPRIASAVEQIKLADGSSITTISDGNLQLPVSFVFADAPGEELKQILEASGQSTETLIHDCNVTLLRKGDRLVMFDVGSGLNFVPSAGKIVDNLAAADIDPAAITDVLFTHAHPDHIWGLVDDFDELLFSEANYYINQLEWDYWRAESTLATVSEERKSFVIGARNRFEYLEDRVNFFSFGDEVIPGVEAFDTSGHTVGHTSFVVHEGSESAMIVGDAVTNVGVSFAKPDWLSSSDHDMEAGAKTRLRLLDRLASEKMHMVGFHMPNPGIGHVEAYQDAYRFVAG